MALKIFEKFDPRANPADANYTTGSIKDESVPGANDGTPLEADWGNDEQGFTDALLDDAGITHSGNPDTVLVSDRLKALKRVVGTSGILNSTDYQSLIDNADSRIYKAGQKISTGAGSWRTVTAVTATVIANTAPQLYAIPLNGVWIEDFGVVEDTDFSVAFRLAITLGVVQLPSKRYIYDGNIIADAVVKIKGIRMPRINDGFTGLESGTIIEGRLRFSGTNIHLENLGADLGTDTAAVSGDAIKCTAPIGTGKVCHIENVIGLGKNVSDAFHAVLLEGFDKLTGGNIVGAHNLFSVVIKCKDVQIDKIFCHRSQNDGLFLKSDTINGSVENANIDSVIVDGNAGQVFGVRIQSDDAAIGKINIGKVIVENCARSYSAEILGTNGVGINEINITDFLSKNATIRDVDLASNKAGVSIVAHSMKNIKCIGTVLEAVKASGVGDLNHVTFDDIFISYDVGASTGQMEAGAVQIGSTVLNSMIGKVTISRNYSTSVVGGITYSNSGAENKLGMYTAKLFGAGVPLSGDSSQALSGATAVLDPGLPDWRGKNITARVTIAANVTVTSMLVNQFAGTLYEIGTVLTIINNSTFTLTMANSGGGKILNRGGAAFVMAGNETASYIFGGVLWHQKN